MKKKTENHTRLFLLLGVVVAFVVVCIFAISMQKRSLSTTNYVTPTLSNSPKTYYSESLKVSILLPSNFDIENGLNSMFIKNNQGEIRIVKQSTNYPDINSYINSLEISNIHRENLLINNNPTIRIVTNSKISYFIYNEYVVYSISTTSPELYDDLDEIAHSFRYVP